MQLIIGLGNPGEKYENNRHNIGHVVADKLKTQNSKLKNVVVTKTNCFMNDSGEFVKKLVEQYHINSSDLWVIHDDLDIPLGSYKIQFGRGPKLHNGVNSIEGELGTDEFWRVRVGVDNRIQKLKNSKTQKLKYRISGEEYVLQDFSDEERAILKPVVEKICKKLATS